MLMRHPQQPRPEAMMYTHFLIALTQPPKVIFSQLKWAISLKLPSQSLFSPLSLFTSPLVHHHLMFQLLYVLARASLPLSGSTSCDGWDHRQRGKVDPDQHSFIHSFIPDQHANTELLGLSINCLYPLSYLPNSSVSFLTNIFRGHAG